MIRCAETGRVPPASGVTVSAAALPAGFLTVRIEFVTAVLTIAIPTICDAPVPLPTTVYSGLSPLDPLLSGFHKTLP